MKFSLGSDNHSGVHPAILSAISKINEGAYTSYGEDSYSQSVLAEIENLFGNKYTAYFTLTGTGANVIALSALRDSFNAILTPDTAHIWVDECGAVERFSGSKLIPINEQDGKISCDALNSQFDCIGNQHHAQPKVISISQCTELGTIYTQEEVASIVTLAHQHGALVHIDGSRLSNAAAATGLSFKELTADMGVDAVSLGGTKNGMLIGEVVLISKSLINSNLSTKYIRKQLGQLYSKSRFIAAQFEAYIQDNLYLRLAAHSNKMAQYLAEQIRGFKAVKLSRSVETNAVFAIISRDLYEKLSQKYCFYIWNETTMEVRLMTAFTTTKENIDEFVTDLKTYINQ